MADAVEQFCERILAINPRVVNIFGKGIPGVSGSSAAVTGGQTSEGENILNLKKATAEFNSQWRQGDKTQAQAEANKIEGCLLEAQTLGTIDAKTADSLIDELHNVMEDK